MTCHLKQVCVRVTEVQGTLDSYCICHFLLCKRLQTARDFRCVLLPEAGANIPVPFQIDYLTLHEAVSKPVKKIQGKADCRAHCCGMSSIALWSCLQATYRHKISSLVNKTTKSKKILENFLV